MTSDSSRLSAKSVNCVRCGIANDAGQKFCSSCGASLLMKCPRCDGVVRVDEKFCGACGTNLSDFQSEEAARFGKTLQQAKEFAEQKNYDSAIILAREIRRDIKRLEFAFLEPMSQEASDLIKRWETERESDQSAFKDIVGQAEEANEAQEYERVVALLGQVDERLYTDEVKQLRNEARRSLALIQELKAKIKTAIQAKKTAHLMPDLERYLQLSPNDLPMRKVAENLRDRLQAAAHKQLNDNQLDEAWSTVSRILPFVSDDSTDKLRQAIATRVWLLRDLKNSSHVDPGLQDSLTRFRKLNPEHGLVGKVSGQIIERIKKTQGSRPPRWMPWAAKNHESAIFDTLDYYPWIKAFAATEQLTEESGVLGCRFAVATGLALQGLQLAAVNGDLRGDAKKSWVSGLTSFRRKSTAAWGMHLGSSSLKLVRLDKPKGESRPKVTHAIVVDYPRSLGAVTSEFERRDLLRNALVEAQKSIEFGDDTIVASIAAVATLARFVEVPPLDDKKLEATIQSEASHQFPFRMDEIHWTSHVFRSGSKNSSRKLMLLAVKRDENKVILEMIQALGIQLATVQCDGVALHNLIRFTQAQDAQMKDAPVALLNCGADGSTLLISHPQQLWFRYLSHGGQRWTRNLATGLKLTQQKAEELKRTPVRYSYVHELYELLYKPLDEFSQEIARSIEVAERDAGLKRPTSLYLTGGSSQLHGFTRALQYGAEVLTLDGSHLSSIRR